MQAIIFQQNIIEFIERYDGENHNEWNETTGEITTLRNTVRAHYLQQQNFRCAYCRIEKKEHHGLTWDVEHIIPKATHPNFLYTAQNLALACKECNIAKGNKEVLTQPRARLRDFPTRSEDYKIVHPHFDTYSDHFELTIVGGKIRHRAKNSHKAKETYIICDLIRFDYKYAEWDNFDLTIVKRFSDFVNKCPPNATKEQISSFMSTITFTANVDF
ncbi:TPA: HNH endonuclease [Pseudomonas aeruginosa]|nr:HNH endonuclease [Pseudomonas aeruginosa]HCJ6280070.1 HNH endonuclease [Pseudomonas aeruginosa]